MYQTVNLCGVCPQFFSVQNWNKLVIILNYNLVFFTTLHYWLSYAGVGGICYEIMIVGNNFDLNAGFSVTCE